MILCVYLKEIIKFKIMGKSKSILVEKKFSTTHLESNLAIYVKSLENVHTHWLNNFSPRKVLYKVFEIQKKRKKRCSLYYYF